MARRFREASGSACSGRLPASKMGVLTPPSCGGSLPESVVMLVLAVAMGVVSFWDVGGRATKIRRRLGAKPLSVHGRSH